MGVQVALWGTVGSTPLTLAAVPEIGSSVILGSTAYPVVGLAYANGGTVYAQVGPGAPFGGAPPPPVAAENEGA